MDLIQLLSEHKANIIKYRKENDIRCINCKTFLRYIKNDWKDRKECKTCNKLTMFQKQFRKNLYAKN